MAAIKAGIVNLATKADLAEAKADAIGFQMVVILGALISLAPSFAK